MTAQSNRVTKGPEIRPREYGCAVLRAEGKRAPDHAHAPHSGGWAGGGGGRGPVLLGLYRAGKCPHTWPCSAWVVRH